MQTTAPTIGRIAIAAGFALSCFGLLLFLWVAFGGPVPLASKSYRIGLTFDEATQLAVESDVRISGVSVGKVKSIELDDDGLADATIEIDRSTPDPVDTQVDPAPEDTCSVETYVELTPGSGDGPWIPRAANLAPAPVSRGGAADEISAPSTHETTRASFQTWMVDAAASFKGRGGT